MNEYRCVLHDVKLYSNINKNVICDKATVWTPAETTGAKAREVLSGDGWRGGSGT
mgnify:CR=1 FL=1